MQVELKILEMSCVNEIETCGMDVEWNEEVKSTKAQKGYNTRNRLSTRGSRVLHYNKAVSILPPYAAARHSLYTPRCHSLLTLEICPDKGPGLKVVGGGLDGL